MGLLTNCARNWVLGVKENVQILMGEIHKFKFFHTLRGSKGDFLALCYEFHVFFPFKLECVYMR